MSIIVREGHDSRKFKVDNKGASAQWKGCAYGSQDQDAIYAAVLASADLPETIGGMNRRSINGDHKGAGFWDVTVDYEPLEGAPLAAQTGGGGGSPEQGPAPTDLLGQEFSFDTSGGTEHIVMSKETRSKTATTAAPAADVLDNKRVIGLSADGKVEGCERGAGKLEFSYSRRVRAIDMLYIISLKNCTYCVNDQPFLGFNYEELLFLGASGQWRMADGWTINYKFAGGKTEFGRDVRGDGTLVIPEIRPWDFVHYGFRQEKVGKLSLARPYIAYVEIIYDRVDFAGSFGWGANP